jgi:hypothetical protein
MTKVNPFKPFLLALLWSFSFGILIFFLSANVLKVLGLFVILSGLTYWLLWRDAKQIEERIWQSIGTLVTLSGWFGVLLLLPKRGFEFLFLLVTVPLFSFLFSTQYSIGEYIMTNRMLMGSFFVSLALAGFSQYFKISSVLIFIVGFGLFVGLIRSTLAHIPHAGLIKLIASVVFGLTWIEWFWVLTFLPLHYTAIGFILWITLYTAWVLYYHYLFHTLNTRKLQFYIAVALILLFLVLFSTPWRIL